MKSQTLSQFQSVMYELNEFGRGKDKQKRKSKGLAIAGGIGGTAAAGYGISAGVRAAKQRGAEKAVIKKGSEVAANLKKNAVDSYSRSMANKAGVDAAKAADKFIEKGGIGKRAVGIAKQDASKVYGAAKNILNSKAGKIGAGVAAGAALAGGAAALLKNRNKNKKK